ncbi:hypothetical protein Agub_g6106 [Astrephomene gubernaculifera]|uniref:Uncharacterized protein n=1 Tax=Astrephomene gubernaculifera TaxID=47775 RepID=A0AAD3DMT8_9CHLO|nr:hypothetical protein Agub_g6106 [Astrephomene gubernaculifera]
MALRYGPLANCQGPRPACKRAAAVLALHSVATPQAPSRLPSARPLLPAFSPSSFGADSRAPHVRTSGGTRQGSHVCAASRKASKEADKEVQFDVSVAVEELSLCRRRATVTVPASAVKEVFKRGVKRLERDVVGSLRGWQAGKPLPLSMIVTQVGGQAKFKTYCLEELLLEALPKGVEAASRGQALDPESVEVPRADYPSMLERYDPARDFCFTALFDVAPPLVWRTPLEAIEVTIRDTGDLASDTAAADDLIRQYRKQHGFSRVVAGRGLQRGDTLVMDMQVVTAAGQQPLPGLTKSRISFDTEEDALDITTGMLGMRAGEVRSFDMSLPHDYPLEVWQGMPVRVNVRVHEVFEWTLPEFDDAYVAAHHGSQWSSATEMREALVASTAMQRMQLLDQQLGEAVVKAVAGALDMPEVPPRMVERLGERQFQAQLLEMINDRVGTREDIEKLATEEMAAEFVQQRRSELEEQVKFNLAVDDIFERQGLTLDEEMVAQEFALRERQMQAVGQPPSREELMEDVRETVKTVIVTEWLKDNIKRHVLPYNSGGQDGAGEGAASGEASSSKRREPVAAA